MTAVVLKSLLHETQNQLHSPLPLTSRPPIEGKPNVCKQEVAKSIVTAEHTNGMIQSANLHKTDTDVDRTALLGRKPAERACGVDEGAKTECEGTQLQQIKFYCEEKHQRNGIANRDLPSALGLLLVGEWLVCASSETSNSNAVKLEACEGGMSGSASVDEADGGIGQRVEPVGMPNGLEMLITTLIESENLGDGDILYVHLGGTSWRAGDSNHPGTQTDMLEGQVDGSRDLTDGLISQMDASRMLNSAETAVMSDGEGVGMYLATGDVRRVVCVMDGIGSPADTSTGHGEVPSVEMDTSRSANTLEIISIPQNKEKPPDLPVEAAWQHPHEPDGCRNFADTLNVHTDMHSIANEMQTAGNVSRNVRTHRTEEKAQNSPRTPENRTSKCSRRWRRVSASCTDVYIPQDVVVHAASRTFIFGQVESGDMAIVPDVEGKTAGYGNGDPNRGDRDGGDGDSTTSSSSVDLL